MGRCVLNPESKSVRLAGNFLDVAGRFAERRVFRNDGNFLSGRICGPVQLLTPEMLDPPMRTSWVLHRTLASESLSPQTALGCGLGNDDTDIDTLPTPRH